MEDAIGIVALFAMVSRRSDGLGQSGEREYPAETGKVPAERGYEPSLIAASRQKQTSKVRPESELDAWRRDALTPVRLTRDYMDNRRASYGNLVSPLESMLLILDDLGDRTGGDQSVAEQKSARLKDLIRTVRECAIPFVLATRENVGSAGILHGALGQSVRPSEVTNCEMVNPWEDDGFRAMIHAAKRSRLLVAGRSSEICVTFTVLSALEEGYDVYVVTDATFGASKEHHETAISRMAQAGAVPVTTRQIIFEWQRGSSTTPEVPDAPGS